MTGDDLKRMQDSFLEVPRELLLKHGHMDPTGYVVTLHRHLDRLFESGYAAEFIDPAKCLRDSKDDTIVTLVIDLSMTWKKLYHAVLTVFPQTQGMLPGLLALGAEIEVDDPYKRVMRPFLEAARLDEKDIIAALMRQICDKVAAFASLFYSEAWLCVVEPGKNCDEIPAGLGKDAKSVEVLISVLETHEFARMITVPVLRVPSKKKRDGGKVKGFGELIEKIVVPGDSNKLEERLMRFLKPLGVAS